jgi:spore maturation protein CgeB
MKLLLIFPSFYSLEKTFRKGFEDNGWEVFHFDYRQHVKPLYEKIEAKKLKLSRNWRNKWEDYYLNKINEEHIQYYRAVEPDLVFIYNNEMLLPKTIKLFKEKSKIFFFLGDSPFYSVSTNRYNLALLSLADKIFAPDTFWIKQLEQIGFENCHFFISASNASSNFSFKASEALKDDFNSDVVFIGRNYADSWGYKRSLFLNSFANLNLKIYGDKSWKSWVDFFPNLKDKIVYQDSRLDFNTVNAIMNCSKVYPVDSNPGILNGLHVRVFDCIQSGILPIVEYRTDIELVFKGINIPIIKKYRESETIAKKFIYNDNQRNDTLKSLQQYIDSNYSPQKSIYQIIDWL